MSLNLDFVGLNNLIVQSASFSSNTIGWSLPARPVIYQTSEVLTTGSYINDKLGVRIPAKDFFAALNLNRNGPCGYASWKQTRLSQNRVSRYHRKNNILSITERSGNIYSENNSAVAHVPVSYREPAVDSRSSFVLIKFSVNTTTVEEIEQGTTSRGSNFTKLTCDVLT